MRREVLTDAECGRQEEGVEGGGMVGRRRGQPKMEQSQIHLAGVCIALLRGTRYAVRGTRYAVLIWRMVLPGLSRSRGEGEGEHHYCLCAPVQIPTSYSLSHLYGQIFYPSTPC
eukprot:811185-Rhodomonas_salina.1